MKNYYHLYDSTIYPGLHIPSIEKEEILRELKHLKKRDVIHPSVNISESPHSFKVEMKIPGMKREEIIIDASDHKLFVFGTHHKQDESNHEDAISYGGFGSHIKLPRNADAEFAAAEYKGGILSMHFHKTNRPAKKQHTRIIVY